MSVWRQTGIKPKELDDLPELPASCAGIWKIFVDLHNARPSGGMSVSPVLYSEIKAYCDLYNEHLEDWELYLIKAFDRVVLEVYAEESEKQQKKQQKTK